MSLDPKELASLWQASSAALTMLARARCRWPDDCVQEAFIKLSQQPAAPRDPVAWLSRVVRNEAISQWRSESRRQRREEAAASDRIQWFESQNANAVHPLDAMQLAQAIESLDVEDREIVIAHVWTGLSFRQIADAFDLSLAMVHRRYHASVDQLRVQLTDRQYSQQMRVCDVPD